MNVQQRLLMDVFRYAERIYLLSHLCSAAIMVSSAMLLLHVSQMSTQPSSERLVLILLLLALVVFLTRSWLAMQQRLGMFVLQPSGKAIAWRVARRREGDPFYPVPRHFIAHAPDPAPSGVCWDLQASAERFAEVRSQIDACRAAHGKLTYHDAANLMLLALSLHGHGVLEIQSSRSPRT